MLVFLVPYHIQRTYFPYTGNKCGLCSLEIFKPNNPISQYVTPISNSEHQIIMTWQKTFYFYVHNAHFP